MRLEQLEYFIEVVKCRSINGAAKNLFISQPNLSQSISNLEKEIGSVLLNRSRQGVIPTLEGVMVYKEALKIVEGVEQSLSKWRKIASENETIRGKVAVMTIPGAMPLFSNHFILELKQSCPKIDVSLYEDNLVNSIQPLITSKATVALGSYREDLEKSFFSEVPEEWKIEPVFKDELSVLMSKKHTYSKKAYLSLDELQKVHLIYYDHLDKPGAPDPFYVEYFNLDSCTRLNRRESIMQLINENGGVAVYPTRITKLDIYRENRQIVAVPIDPALKFPHIIHYLAYKKDFSMAEKKTLEIMRHCINTYILEQEIMI